METTNTDDIKSPEVKRPGFGKLLSDLLFSIAIPVFILRKFSAEESLGPTSALMLALVFPLMAGIYEFVKDKKIGLVPSIGFVSILLTGGIAALQLPKEYIVLKEALVPLVLGAFVVLTIYTKKPLVRILMFNDMFLETEKVNTRIQEKNNQTEFDALMVKATWIMASSFLVSSALNYILDRGV